MVFYIHFNILICVDLHEIIKYIPSQSLHFQFCWYGTFSIILSDELAIENISISLQIVMN